MTADSDSSVDSTAEQDVVHELPPSPKALKRSSTLSYPSRRTHGHSKHLSLNFPLLLPTATAGSRSIHDSMSPPELDSPSSGNRSPTSTTRPVHVVSQTYPKADTTECPDFLTLLASQERRVLELKEELQKAESELSTLKKQWAVHEANKKRGELKHKTVKLGPVSPKTSRIAEDEDTERERRREAREKRLKGLGIVDNDGPGALGSARKSGQRVFEGRHTRTLSLLQSSGSQSPSRQNDSTPSTYMENYAQNLPPRMSETSGHHAESKGVSPSLSPTQPLSKRTIPPNEASVSSTGADALSFGKTYKDLANAAGRRSIPPGADVFVKQGRQVYEGVSQGFWNFVEDIRQATIGEEAINGNSGPAERDVRRTKSQAQLQRDGSVCERHGKRGIRRPFNPLENNMAGKQGTDRNKKDKDVFWKEFGLETPQAGKWIASEDNIKPIPLNVQKERNGGREHESKSSTDSKSPPDLLADLIDGNDEEWDHWPTESPMSLKRHSTGPLFRERNSVDEQDETAAMEAATVPDNKASTALGTSSINWVELTR